jgi:hypothetical protein
MPHNGKDPAGANHWAFYRIKFTYPSVPSLSAETKCFLRQLAMAYREAVTSEDPRVMRLGLQILWHHLVEILQAEAE